jgi:hypothetical protein
VKTGFGLLRASQISGALTAENSNGSVQASGVTGAANVRTSFGGVTLDGVGGAVDVDNQNGSVEVRAEGRSGCQPIAARTSFSVLRVYVPDGANYDVEARTSFGKVISEHAISVTGEVGGSALTGKMGSGGCVLRLINSNGNVEILKAAGMAVTPAKKK